MEPIKVVEHNGHTIEVHYDFDPESPRAWDNLGVMCFKHNRYDLPWENEYTTWREVNSVAESWDEVLAALKKSVTGYKVKDEVVLALPVWMLDHSGLHFSTQTNYSHLYMGMDSGRVGWIYTTRQQVKKIMGWSRLTKERLAQLEKQLCAEVETYSQWQEGQVFGYIVKDADGEEVDACWGFYDMDDMIEEAKGLCGETIEATFKSTCGLLEAA